MRYTEDLSADELRELRAAIQAAATGLGGQKLSRRMRMLLERINFGQAVTVETGHTHPRVCFVWGWAPYASTPSDVRAHRNWTADVFMRRAAYLSQS